MITIKQGSTFKLSATVEGDGAPIAGGIGAWEISSQLRKPDGTLVDTFICTITDAAECTYTIEQSAAGVTVGWPITTLNMDIRYAIGGEIFHTETATVNVIKSVTVPVIP